jgi:RND family efflux transporter MFP subunit
MAERACTSRWITAGVVVLVTTAVLALLAGQGTLLYLFVGKEDDGRAVARAGEPSPSQEIQFAGPGQAGAGKKSPPSQQLLERFDALAPAERLTLVEKHTKGAKEFLPVVREDLVSTVVARGSLEAAANADVYCRIRSGAKSGSATTIKWIIDAGTEVSKGDIVVELDAAPLREQLKDQRIKLDLVRADATKAAEDLELIRQDNEANVLACEIESRTAALALKKHTSDDADEKEILKLHIERARLNMTRAKALGRSREAQAQATLDAKKAIVDVEQSRIRDIEEQIQACRIVAPQGGMVVYYVPEQVRGAGPQSIVAQGEPVREGQKLLQIPNLLRMVVQTRVPEALVSELHNEVDGKGQPSQIRVDAFPNRILKGHVKTVDPVASQSDWFASDVKVYKALVSIDDKLDGLKPGMSAEVAIETGRAAGVLQVPLQAVVRVGLKHFCYVKNGLEIDKIAVQPGVRNDSRVEIKAGLKAGQEVLRDPVGLLRRSSAAPTGGAAVPHPSVHVRSVRHVDPDAPARRSAVVSYGLTHQDLDRIAALPSVAQAVPARRFPYEVRHRERTYGAAIVATTPELADVLRLPLESGRFLTTEDVEERRNVVVLGGATAEALFPLDNALGHTIVLNKDSYLVIGVLGDDDVGVYLPLTTCQARFGERVIIRKGGARTAEAVQVSDIYVMLESPQDRAGAVESIRGLLEVNHPEQDWAIEGS